MTSSSRFVVQVEAPNTATRPNGANARARLRELLGKVDKVTVDMSGIVLTPSFADEFLGVLLIEIGESRFRESVRIENVSDSARPLLRTVLQRRADTSHPVQQAGAA